MKKIIVTLFIFLVPLVSTYASTVIPIELDAITEVNFARTNNGLNTLAFDNILFEGSRFHAEDMASTGILSNNLSDGTHFAQNYRNFGYPQAITGNLTGSGWGDASSYINALMNSSEHRDILLETHWKGIGVG